MGLLTDFYCRLRATLDAKESRKWMRKVKGCYASDLDCGRAANFTVGLTDGGGPRFASRLHGGQLEPGDSAPGCAHGVGDGAGVIVCRGRRLLGGKARGQWRGHGWTEGVDGQPGVRGGHGAEAVDHGNGGTARRRKRS